MTSVRPVKPALTGFSEARQRRDLSPFRASRSGAPWPYYFGSMRPCLAAWRWPCIAASGSLPFAAADPGAWSATTEVREALASPRISLHGPCSALIVFNWGFYVWSIEVGRTRKQPRLLHQPAHECGDGLSVPGRALHRQQVAALALVALGVVIQTFAVGVFPWLGLMLAATFCLYGLIRKNIAGRSAGFFVEICYRCPSRLLTRSRDIGHERRHFSRAPPTPCC